MNFIDLNRKLKSNKGITMMSLLVYVVAFLMVSGIIGAVTTFFFSNYNFLNSNVSDSSEYNKLNLCFVEETKKDDVYIYSHVSNKTPRGDYFYNDGQYTDIDKGGTPTVLDTVESEKKNLLLDINSRCNNFFNTYILFSDGNFIGYREKEKIIYYNQSELCKNVEKLSINVEYKNGRTVIKVLVGFENKSFSTKYTVD